MNYNKEKYPGIRLIRFIAFLWLTACFLQMDPAFGQQRNQPNVILILADDMGVGDIALHNGGLNRTPNLDKLIQESVLFNQGYSASAVCAPARAALLTGRYPHRTGVTMGFTTMFDLGKNEMTLADVFVEQGYYTGLIGKWHLGIPQEYQPQKRGFKEAISFIPAFDLESYFKYKLAVNGKKQQYDGPYLTEVLTDSAVSFINRNKDRPFFLHLTHYAPHRPLQAPSDKVDYYINKGFDKKTANTYAMVEIMDTGIGNMMDELDRLGIRENTIVIFASDNGPDPLTGSRFNHDLKGRKYEVYEGGIRVPLILNWKGKLAPRSYEEVFHFVDVFPTVAALCGVDLGGPVGEKLDGVSIAQELLSGKERKGRLARYWQWNRGNPYYSHNAAVREGDWKLVRPPVTHRVVETESDLKPLLFNLKEDPAESTDVSAQNERVYNRLKIILEDWCRKMEANRLETTSFHGH